MPEATTAFTAMERVMSIRGLAPRTQQAYHRQARHFVEQLERPWRAASAEDAADFFLRERIRGMAPASVALSYAALKVFFHHVLLRRQDFDQLPRPRKKRCDMDAALTREEVQALLDAAQNPYQRVMFETLYATGLRVGEVRVLRAEDIDSRAGLLHVRHGKGDKARSLHLSGLLLETLRDHWGRHSLHRPWIFPSAAPGRPQAGRTRWGDKPIHASTIQRWFQAATRRAELRRRATPHDMRRAYATHLLEAGTNLRVVQVLLGHTDPRTTARYLSVSAEVVRSVPCPLELLTS